MIESIMNIDVNILLWIQDNLRNAFLTPVFAGITKLGDIGLIWIIISLGMLFFRKTRATGTMCLIALICSVVVNNLLLKNLVARARPFDTYQMIIPLISRPTDFSFPSGHTAASFACAGVMYRHLPKKAGISSIILAVLIAFSRLYLGVHYPSDVLIGGISGFLMGCAAELIYKKAAVMISRKKAAKAKQ